MRGLPASFAALALALHSTCWACRAASCQTGACPGGGPPAPAGLALIQRPLPAVRRDGPQQLHANDAADQEPQAGGNTSSGSGAESSGQGGLGHEVSANESVSVVSYNMFWWNVAAAGRMREFYERLRGELPVDLIALQECDDVATALQKAGLDHFEHFQGPSPNPCPLAWNGEVFAKLGEPGSAKVARDRWGDRHMAWVRLQHRASGRTLLFANTHGPLNGCSNALGMNWVEGINAQLRPGDVAFLAGDFNCLAESPAFREVLAAGLFAEDLDGGIDHILSTGRKLKGELKPGFPSDHPLVRGTFTLADERRPEAEGTGTGTAGEGASGCGELEDGFDYQGGDLQMEEVLFRDDAEECSEACRDHAGCLSFTFAKASGACYLKGAAKPGRSADGCCISGLPACEARGGRRPEAGGCGEVEEDVDYSGGDMEGVDVLFAGSARACGAACRGQRGCRSFTWARESRACYLKDKATPKRRRRSSCCVSGPPSCGHDGGGGGRGEGGEGGEGEAAEAAGA